MSMPAPRDMPVVQVIGPLPDRSYICCLPGGLRVPAKTRDAVEVLVKRAAPGSAIKWVPAG